MAFTRTLVPPAALALFLGIACQAAHALPTQNPLPGITGLGSIPTTDTVPLGGMEVALSYEHVELKESSGDVDLLPVANLSYGFKRGEVGAAYVREHTDVEGFSFRNSYFALHGKYRVLERPDYALAVGAHYYDFGSDDGFDLGHVLSGYLTGSYTFRRRSGTRAGEAMARLHAGLLYQRLDGGDGEDDNLLRPFVGAEYLFTPSLSLAADYLDDDANTARVYNVALRYTPPGSRLSGQIGVGRLRDDTRYFATLSYRFGGESNSAAPSETQNAPITPGVRP